MKSKKLLLPGMLLLACASMLFNSGCKKVSDANPTPLSNPDTTVYALGFTQTGAYATLQSQAVVWKDGVAIQLPGLPGQPSTYARVFAISGSDVYVPGSCQPIGGGDHSTPVYWKNGVITQLQIPVSSPLTAYTDGIAISGNDVYIGGTINNNHTGNAADAGYWKNGVFTSLADPANYYNSSAWNIAVSGSDVYVCGGIDLNDGGGQKAVYWKNGVLHALTESSDFAWATKIYVQNNDVYVLYDQITTGTTIMQSHYWKNGADVQLPTDLDGSYAWDMQINGNDAYIVGNTSHQVSASVVHNEAVIWKNNVAHTLFDGGNSENGYAYAVTVSGSNVYIAGQAGADQGYWKNGVVVKIPGAAGINAIAVVKN